MQTGFRHGQLSPEHDLCRAPTHQDQSQSAPSTGVVDLTREIGRLDFALTLLEQNAAQSSAAAEIQTRIAQNAAIMAARLGTVRAALATVLCPAVIDPARPSLADYCRLPDKGRSAPAGEVLDRVYGCYFEVLGRLAALAIEAEMALPVQHSAVTSV